MLLFLSIFFIFYLKCSNVFNNCQHLSKIFSRMSKNVQIHVLTWLNMSQGVLKCPKEQRLKQELPTYRFQQNSHKTFHFQSLEDLKKKIWGIFYSSWEPSKLSKWNVLCEFCWKRYVGSGVLEQLLKQELSQSVFNKIHTWLSIC